MDSCAPAAIATAPTDTPFSSALALTPIDTGDYQAELPKAWTVGGGKLHGGLMLALLTKAGLAGLRASTVAADGVTDRAGVSKLEPVAVTAEFLRAPRVGPVELVTEVLKTGRTASVVRVAMRQDGRAALTGTVTAGQLPEDPPAWASLPAMPPEPPSGAAPTSDGPGPVPPLARACELVLDPDTASFTRGELGEPVLRGWVRPRGEEPDVLFALLAGDVMPPTLFNRGRLGWTPTVQLAALVRGRPAPGWLRLEVVSRTIRGNWFDEDYTVIDSAGRLICQARQLALTPLEP